ncbi:MAG TPA: biotin--[acetyl-CoA-carboxylase] ligase, partial [Segetibacter sp.]
HGATWFAHYQNAGKGQRGKTWKAEPSQNIMMSIVLKKPSFAITNQYVMNMAVALSCHNFFNAYTGANTTIKWPNDIYWRDRKAGGILIETVQQGNDWKYAVVGIGININQTLFPENLPNAVSLKQITGKNFEIISLAKGLCNLINDRWNLLLENKNKEILKEYNSVLYKLNSLASFKSGNTKIMAVVKGVNLQGELLLETEKGVTVPFTSLTWLMP